ncbi:MAG TPA: DUF89 family protein [Clostridiaceae bacterium]|nr:DUF89 family protein [Clostridiaceae bacterium]
METFLDCLPCVLGQVLEASRMATDDAEIQAKIMEKAVAILADYKQYSCSPAIVRDMHQVVKQLTGVSDPYSAIKARDIRAAKKAEPFLTHFLEQKQDKLYWALKIAATGNILDSAICQNVDIEAGLETELNKAFSVCDIGVLQDALATAKQILIIGDNAGETVFDRFLIKQLAALHVVYAVRSEPIINDATMQDALDSGLHDLAEVISTGCGAPGAILAECSPAFLSAFESSDIVISKGQGNFEALSDCQRPLFFILKAKCTMIAARLSVSLNDYVCLYATPSAEASDD